MQAVIDALLTKIAARLKNHEWKLVTAESCTGGGLAFYLTSLSGSSEWFERGMITYSNEAKMTMLAVKSDTLTQQGAVSEQIAREMAEGAISHSQATVSIAITGIAGPTGGTKEKPVGTVWFAWCLPQKSTQAKKYVFSGNRVEIRQHAIVAALEGLVELL